MDIENLMVAVALETMYQIACRDLCGWSETRKFFWFQLID